MMSIRTKQSLSGHITTKCKLMGVIGINTVIELEEAHCYILVDEEGTEVAAVLLDEEVTLTATKTNDIRVGMTAVTEDGVVTGEKEIPSYYVTEGFKLVRNGAAFNLFIPNYDYTKLQAIVCAFNTTMSNSVAAEKVVINDGVYPTGSTVAEAMVVKNDDTKSIDFGIINTSGAHRILRYFSYKEIY